MIRPARRPRPRAGVSLMEVLVSLTIMLLSLTAIAQLVEFGSDHGNEARMTSWGSRLAQAKMAEVEAGVLPVQQGGDGNFDGDDSDWAYSVASQSQGAPNLYQVTVTVSRDLKGRKFQLVLNQMLFDPAMQGSTSQAEQPSDADVTSASSSSGTGGSGGSSGSGTTTP